MRISCIAVVFPVVMWWELFVDNVPVCVLVMPVIQRYCSTIAKYKTLSELYDSECMIHVRMYDLNRVLL